MKKTIAPEVIKVSFVDKDEVILTSEDLCRLEHYLDAGYESTPLAESVMVSRKAYIELKIQGTEVVDATRKLLPWYGVKKPTAEIALQVEDEIKSGILEVVCPDEDLQETDFRRHSLHQEDVAV